jgi:hypothetical protein
MKKSELELVIKRLDKMGYTEDGIKWWLNIPLISSSNCSAIQFLEAGLFHIVINKLDELEND